ncbi:Protein-methionine-sulfoxide reductase heme-binding subunit MsrQ [hydrothermal vent metagenome]|uniref:Protein-methionine-sulfoxide reductase heme-binding subunit MsrQ n=1 Tax=hydrothermal vent metagenome TaxID=652676 RepID=A0A3B0X139_9ZZZZ
MHYIVKLILFLLCLLPFILLLADVINNKLGTNPVETLTHETGLWALRFLLISLTITPLRKISKINELIKFRRMLGLFAFFYACLHFITYVWFDQFFDWREILIDIPKRPFITIGFVSFILLLPLAITSTNNMQRRLKKKWRILHRLVYVIPVLVVIHFIWSLKADYTEPFFYALVFSLLMFIRFFYYRKKTSKV